MAQQGKRAARREREEVFYEAMPLAHRYGDFALPAEEEEAPDRDFAEIEDSGREVAIRTLIFVALATVIICLLLIWAVQAAQEVLPATNGTVPPGR